MTGIPIAYITARYPPMVSSGTFRVEAILDFLPAHGFVPHVVTIPSKWVEHQSAVTGESRPATTPVLRPTHGLDPVMRALSSVPVVRRVLRDWVVPDILAPWARGVIDEVALELEDCQLVYATAPPYSALVLADCLSRRLQVPLVQEVRDPPSFNRRLHGRRAAFRRRMRDFERRYLSSADAVVTVTPGTRNRLLELHSELEPERVVVIPNGYPELTVDPSKVERSQEVFTITYAGTYQGGTRHRPDSWFSPEVILPYVAKLPGQAEVRVVGRVNSIQAKGLSSWYPLVKTIGQVSRDRALSEMAAADVVVILAEDDPWWIGRKVYEYLVYARRILGIVPAGDTSDLLSGSDKSTLVRPGDDDGLESALHQLYEEWKSGLQPSGPEPAIQSDREIVEDVGHLLSSLTQKLQE